MRDKGVRLFFNKSWIFRGSLWNLSPWHRIERGHSLPFNISTVEQNAKLQKESTSIEANNATSSRPIERAKRSWNSCRRKIRLHVETREKMDDRALFRCFHCVDCHRDASTTPYRDQQSFYQHRSYHAWMDTPAMKPVTEPLQNKLLARCANSRVHRCRWIPWI